LGSSDAATALLNLKPNERFHCIYIRGFSDFGSEHLYNFTPDVLHFWRESHTGRWLNRKFTFRLRCILRLAIWVRYIGTFCILDFHRQRRTAHISTLQCISEIEILATHAEMGRGPR